MKVVVMVFFMFLSGDELVWLLCLDGERGGKVVVRFA